MRKLLPPHLWKRNRTQTISFRTEAIHPHAVLHPEVLDLGICLVDVSLFYHSTLVGQGSFRIHQISWKNFQLGMPWDHAISNLPPESHSCLKSHPKASQELSYRGRKPSVSHLNICNSQQLFQEPELGPVRVRPSLGNIRLPAGS